MSCRTVKRIPRRAFRPGLMFSCNSRSSAPRGEHLALGPAASGPTPRCLQPKRNFCFSTRCFADSASFNRQGYDHENHVRHPRVGADRRHLRDLFGRLLNECRILAHFCPGPGVSGYRPRAQTRIIYHFTNEEDGKTLRRYWTTACQGCVLKGQCTTGKERRISRWEHEAILEAVPVRLDRNPAKMRLRRQTVEHPSAR
jgi:hypothetical protein